MKTKTLQEIFDELVEKGHLSKSRIAPCKSSLRQYALLLKSEMSCCPVGLFNKPVAERNRLIDENLKRTKRNRKSESVALSDVAIRNTKNNVSFVLRKAGEAGLIPSLKVELSSWKESRKALPQFTRLPPRRECLFSEKYILDPVPNGLRAELACYRVWCTSEFNPERPRTLKRRSVTFDTAHDSLLRIAGFLVKFRGLSANAIALADLCIPEHVQEFARWFIEARGKSTVSVSGACAYSRALARYFQITATTPSEQQKFEDRVRGLKQLRDRLPVNTPAYDKSKRWLSLKQIEAVGLAYDPSNPERFNGMSLKAKDRLQRELKHFETEGAPRGSHHDFTRNAANAGFSLMMRLLVRIPFRQRNLREMAWNPTKPEDGQNLFKRNGQWFLRYSGKQLKIGTRNNQVNSVEYEFPHDLTAVLERWLYMWRPLLTKLKTANFIVRNDDVAARVDNQEHVFLNAIGGLYSDHLLLSKFKQATYRYTKVAVNPHMLRTIWATEYILDTNNFIDAAYMLNDKVETVLKHYAHLTAATSESRAQAWLAQKLSN